MLLKDEPSYMEDDVNEQMANKAEQFFREGFNCCESILRSSTEVLDLNLPDNVYLMGRFFKEGTGSGCICGALAGSIMILGYVSGTRGINDNLAEKFRGMFIDQFGSTCCRVIRKNQSLAERFRNRECRRITKVSAGFLQELIK